MQLLGSSIKKCLLYPYLSSFNHPLQNIFLARLANKLLLFHFHQKIAVLSLFSSEMKKERKNEKILSYLPNQNIQGRGTTNKQFFKDGFGVYIFYNIEIFVCVEECI